jgi:hypothetical protein
VPVTFDATLPHITPPGDVEIYMAGNFNGWDPADTMMTRTDLFAQAGSIILTESGELSRPQSIARFNRK